MKRILPLLLFIFCFLFFTCKGQNHIIDSLKRVLKSEKEDTNKVNTLNSLSRQLINLNKFDTSLVVSNQALVLSGKLGYENGRGFSLNNIGVCNDYQGNDTVALKYYTDAMSIFQKTGNKRGEASIYVNSGAIYINIGNYQKAIENSLKGLTLSKEIGYEAGYANGLQNVAIAYFKQGKYTKALEYDFKSLDNNQKNENKVGYAHNLCNIGIVYADMGNFPRALEYYYKSLALDQKIGNKYGAAYNYGAIGSIYFLQGNNQKALECDLKSLNMELEIGDKNGCINNYGLIGEIYQNEGNLSGAMDCFNKALALLRETPNSEGMAATIALVGRNYFKARDYPEALENFFKAIAISKETGNNKGIVDNYANIGNCYAAQKKYSLAKAYLDSALYLSKNTGNTLQIETVYFSLSGVDSATGDYKAAWEDNKNYMICKDNIDNEKIVQAEMNYEFDRKTDSAKAAQDKLNVMALKEKQRQKVIKDSLWGGFSVMFLAAGVFFIQRRRISKEKKRSDDLLTNILPKETADELKATGAAKARSFDMVTVMFTDFKDFTQISETLSPAELVNDLHTIFHAFDNIIHKHTIEKIKTIGDSYMAAGGLPIPNKTHAKDVVSAALKIVKFMEAHNQQRMKEGKPVFEIRIGINSGPVVAGIVGIKKFAYDIWGDTVNLASRMESSGEPGKINISGSTYELVKNDFNCTYRGKIQAKNKGEVDMYFVS